MSRIQQIQVRRGTAATWTSTNPTLAAGEMGWEYDTNKVKIGDGSSAWNSLPYSPKFDDDALTTGQFSLRRKEITGNGVTASTGTLLLGYFTADKTETINTLDVATGATAAGATPTICRMGIYSLDASGNGTLVASTVNDTTLFAATNTIYSKALSSSFSKVAGTRYCTALIVVTAATAPSFHGLQMVSANPVNTWSRLAPPISGRLLSQTDLPSTFTVGSLVGVQGIVGFYMH